MKVSKEAKIGVFAFAMLIVLYAGNNYLSKNERLKRTDTYYVEYATAGGVQRKSPVLINGVQVGTVTAVELSSNTEKVLVSLQVNAQYKLPQGTVASVASGGILDKKNITLRIPASVTAYHKSGDTLVAAPIGGDLMGMAAPMASKADSLLAQLNSMATAMQAMMSLQNQDNVANALHNISDVSGMLASTVTQLNALLNDNRKGVTEMVSELGSASHNLNEVTATLNVEKANIAAVIRNADTSLANLNALTAMLSRYVEQGTLLSTMQNDSLYINLNRTVQSLDALLVDIKQHPKEYVHLSVFGK